MRAKDAVGRYGESVATRHLTDAGLTVLARNWRCAAGEIDVVALDRDTLVICEVKTRSTGYCDPAEAVTRRKAAKLRELALWWLREHPGDGRDIRFDVVSVVLPRAGAAQVEHLRAVL